MVTDPASAWVNRKGPILLQNNARTQVSLMTPEKWHEFGYQLPTILIQPLSYRFSLFLFAREILQKPGRHKNDFNKFFPSRTPDCYTTKINKLVFLWQLCLLHRFLFSLINNNSAELWMLKVENRQYFLSKHFELIN